jgi:hypothetical protein
MSACRHHQSKTRLGVQATITPSIKLCSIDIVFPPYPPFGRPQIKRHNQGDTWKSRQNLGFYTVISWKCCAAQAIRLVLPAVASARVERASCLFTPGVAPLEGTHNLLWNFFAIFFWSRCERLPGPGNNSDRTVTRKGLSVDSTAPLPAHSRCRTQIGADPRRGAGIPL